MSWVSCRAAALSGAVLRIESGKFTGIKLPPTASLSCFQANCEGQAASVGRTRRTPVLAHRRCGNIGKSAADPIVFKNDLLFIASCRTTGGDDERRPAFSTKSASGSCRKLALPQCYGRCADLCIMALTARRITFCSFGISFNQDAEWKALINKYIGTIPLSGDAIPTVEQSIFDGPSP